jgi:hypothetical protein
MNLTALGAGASLGLFGLLLVPAGAQSIPTSWVARFDGPAHYDDFATAGAVLPSGNVVVTGTTWWEPQPGLFVPKFFTAAYTPQGNQLWSQLYGSGYYGGNGASDLVAIAPGDKVVVAGQRNLGGDWVTLQYDAAGVLQWETLWLAGSSFVSSPDDIAIDGAGNTYLCGHVGIGGSRAAVIKIGPTGTLLWTHLYNGAGLDVDYVSSIATDAAGAVFIAGGAPGAGGVRQMSVARLDPVDGKTLWLRNYGPTTLGTYAYARALALDGAGNIVAGGEVDPPGASNAKFSFVSYAADGTLQWSVDHATPATATSFLQDIAVTTSGDVAAVGSMSTASQGYDWIVVRVSGGQVAWEHTFGGAALLDDYATSVAMDVQGNVYAGGSTEDPNAALELRVYSPGGGLIGRGRELATPSGFGYGADLALAPSGRVYLFGELGPFAATGGDAVTAAFDLVSSTLYCVGKVNSLGCIPHIGATGIPSATAGSGFVVTDVNVLNNKSGILLYGTSGRLALPFQGGTLCVQSPRRTPAVSSGGSPPPNNCSGAFSIDMNCFATGGCGGNPLPALTVPGTLVDCQWWGRDPGFAPPQNTSLSDALEYTVQP